MGVRIIMPKYLISLLFSVRVYLKLFVSIMKCFIKSIKSWNSRITYYPFSRYFKLPRAQFLWYLFIVIGSINMWRKSLQLRKNKFEPLLKIYWKGSVESLLLDFPIEISGFNILFFLRGIGNLKVLLWIKK